MPAETCSAISGGFQALLDIPGDGFKVGCLAVRRNTLCYSALRKSLNRVESEVGRVKPLGCNPPHAAKWRNMRTDRPYRQPLWRRAIEGSTLDIRTPCDG
ncbi:protein of unknown function [Methylocaldum szegediense]|uniref:Uncharacterized protein n=1 Tax=Methylocaldum szegediense TaxID=73780 RepID=A0ABN8XCW2_9GAMM|nr:protein of unknown function [Methylocaldum szegediense]